MRATFIRVESLICLRNHPIDMGGFVVLGINYFSLDSGLESGMTEYERLSWNVILGVASKSSNKSLLLIDDERRRNQAILDSESSDL